jgi:bifunctional oligoribonuclease and PAP phosphatase NrnA
MKYKNNKQLLEIIKKANNILLTLHPSPDGDSIGSNLAFYQFLKNIKKKVTLISGDSKLPDNYKIFPFYQEIIPKNIFQINWNEYDLFISLDIASYQQISKLNEITIPKSVYVVNIDHHISNVKYGNINYIQANLASTCEIVFNLFQDWKVKINKNIAACLIAGIYDDSQFKYDKVTYKTFEIASKLAKINPQFHKYLFEIDNNNSPEKIKFVGIALSNIENYFNDKVAISSIPFEIMQQYRFPANTSENTDINNILKSVIGWDIGINFFEYQKDKIKIGFRTRNPQKYNLTKIAKALGGGGHVSAAGANLNIPFAQAKDLLLKTLKKVYNL